MTVRSLKGLDTDPSALSSTAAADPNSSSSRAQSPPKKKLRLSLKGQRLLGSAGNSVASEYPTLNIQDRFLEPESISLAAFPKQNLEKNPSTMHNIRPSLLDPMGMHSSFVTGGSLSLVSSSYSRMDMNGDSDVYERDRDRDRLMRLEPSSNNDKLNQSPPPVATLLNLGNTCFLNSVLYTLRFTPGFAHLVHHLATDLTDKKLISTSSGYNDRKIGFLSSGSPGLRTKSLSSLSPAHNNDDSNGIDPANRKILVLTERLHELLQTLHNAEQKGDLSEPYQADAFLQALREVNPLFQGNQQQDAHELLVCFLDYLREACQLVDRVQAKSALVENAAAAAAASAAAVAGGGIAADKLLLPGADWNSLKRGKLNLDQKKKKGRKIFADRDKDKSKKNAATTSAPAASVGSDNQPKVNTRISDCT